MLAIWIRHEMKWLVANREMIIWVAMDRRWNDHNKKSVKQIAKEANAKIVQITRNLTQKFKLNPMTYNPHQTAFFKGLFHKTRGNYKPCIQTLHIHILCTFLQPKKIHITCHTRNCHYDAQNSDDDHNTHGKNITKSHCKYQNHVALNWKKSCKKLNKNAQKYTYQEKKNWHSYPLVILTWKIIIKQPRMHQETHSNFLGIFAKNLTRIEVQIASIRVHIARKLKKLKESQSLRVKSPNPNTQMDPDLQNASGALDW